MNIEEYIESGILGLYVMGNLEPEEQERITALAKSNPTIRKEIELIEKSLINLAESSATKELSTSILQGAMSRINEETSSDSSKTIGIDSRKYERKSTSFSFAQFGSIAASVLLLISIGLNLYLYNNWQDANEQVAILEQQNTVFADDLQVEKAKYLESENQLATVTNPNIISVKLKGVETKPDALATVFWNSKTKETYVNVNNLPTPPEGMQYQLWALQDGKPIDAGVFDLVNGIQSAKNIEKAQAFAITLEEAGGQPTPNLEQLYVIGNV